MSVHHSAVSPTGGGSTLAWINQSGGSLSDDDACKIVEALNLQAPSIAQAWNMAPNKHVLTTADKVPPGAVKAYFLPSADVAGALGYHAVDPAGDPYIRVFVDTVLNNGGTALSGALSVSVCASHEAVEEAADPMANLYSQAEANGNQVAVETADPVESDSYLLTLADGTAVAVSDFVYPSFFDPGGTAPFDHLGLVTAPFQIRKGGYEIVKDPTGTVSQVFGAEYPAWRKATKTGSGAEASRTARRLRAKHGQDRTYQGLLAVSGSVSPR